MKYDVIVIGAGMAGLLTAYYLQEEGKKVLVLEAKEVASGQTGRTTAKITSQHGMKYTELVDKIGVNVAHLYANANEEAIREYEKLIEKEQIDCHFERLSSYLYTRNPKKKELLKREADLAFLFDIKAYYLEEMKELPFSIEGACCFENQAQFDADTFVAHIASKLEIWEHAKVIAVRDKQVVMKDTTLTAEYIVVVTHYPFLNFPGFYFLRQHQERSYVLALSECEESGKGFFLKNKITGMYYGIDQEGLSLRQKGDILLLGGSGRRTGEHTCSDSYGKLIEKAKEYYPDAKVEDMWSAQDCMPHDGIPFIGKYSVFTPHVYVATGFQKWGMSTSMVAAHIIRDMICGKDNPYKKVFSPQRLLLRAGWSDFIKDVGVSIKGLWNGLVLKKEPCCAHLGCGLHYNSYEKIWECPCHGSRFDEEGEVLDNPARYDINLPK